MKKFLAMLVTATVIGAGGVTVAAAASSPKASTTTTKAAKPAGSSVQATVGSSIRKLAFSTAGKTIGISSADLLKDMKGGHSIADVATAHSVDPHTVVTAIESAIDGRIDTAASNGKITSDQATKLKAIVANRVPKLVNATPKQLARHAIRVGAITVAAKTIGVTPVELRKDFAAGQTVAQVAAAHNVASATVVSALVTAGDKRVDALVANQHISAARAGKLKARIPTAAQRFVDRARGQHQKAGASA